MSSSYYNGRNLDKVIWRVNDSPSNFTLMLCCTETVRVVPRISVCNDYHVPVTPKQAEAFLRGRLGIDVKLDNAPSVEYEISAVKDKSKSTIADSDIKIYLEIFNLDKEYLINGYQLDLKILLENKKIIEYLKNERDDLIYEKS